jgi:hypothetical protein
LCPIRGQPSPAFYVPTRRVQSLRTRAEVDAFRKGRILGANEIRNVLAHLFGVRCNEAVPGTVVDLQPTA